VRTFGSIDEFARAAGETFGPTAWLTVDQGRVGTFADATDDHQWIHVDPERARGGPFGGTIAHGLLTLSLLPGLLSRLYTVENVSMAVNYGFNKVRFPAPVPVGSRIRLSAVVAEVRAGEGFVESVLTSTFEIEGSEKPGCVVESVGRLYA
jgi:acyl dehydratase